MVPMYLAQVSYSSSTSVTLLICTYMRVNYIVNIIGCKSALCEALGNVRISAHWLPGLDVFLYWQWIVLHVSSQA